MKYKSDIEKMQVALAEAKKALEIDEVPIGAALFDNDDKLFHPSNLVNGDVIKKNLQIKDGPILGELLQYLSKELAYKRLNNFDEAIYKAKQWIEQNAPKCD